MTTQWWTASRFPIGAVLVVAVLAVFVDAGHPAADAQSAQERPSFRADVELVLLDASVLDAKRRPVRGLTASDFTILEDGRPQTIQTFTAIDEPGPSEEAAVAPWTRDVVSDVRSNDEFKHGRIVVLVLDDATPTPVPDVLRVKKVARRAIDALGPDDLAAVVFPLNKKEGIDFTHDRARLRAAVDRFNGSVDDILCNSPVAIPFDRFNPCATTLYKAMIGCLTDLARYLTALPDRRKTLMFVSVGMPLDVEGASPMTYSAESADAAGITRQLIGEVTDAFRAAQRANVAIYCLDPGGLRAPNEVGVRSADPFNAGRINREFLHAVALNTGGFAVTDTNSPDAGISQILLESTSYYLIGYAPANRREDGKFRRIEVRVNRPGVTVRTRTGYFERRADKEPSREETSGDGAALAGIVPKSDLRMQATAAVFAQPGKPAPAVAFALAVRQPAPAGLSQVARELDVRVKAYSPDGRERTSVDITAKATLVPTQGDTIYEVVSKLDLAPGRYQLRFAAADALGRHRAQPVARAAGMPPAAEAPDRRRGSVYLDLDVPDFSEPLALSAIVVSSAPGFHTAIDKNVRAMLPIVPTTRREFTSDNRVTAFARVHQGGKKPVEAVTIAARLVDGNGITVFQATETLAAGVFAKTRNADYLVDVPIERLNDGPHLLTIDASAGQKTSRSEVRFTKR